MAARAGRLMQTRKDLYQAHRLMTQRVALALLQGSPSAAESPLRRTGVGALCGVMVVVLVAAGFGIAGLLFKGGARNLERPGVLIIEKETGATYAYNPETRKLVPFLNYASARLAMPTTEIHRKLVSSRSLAEYARGPLAGIPDAPESLPDPGKRPKTWSLCVRGGTVSLVGGHDVGGRPLDDTQGVVVRGGTQNWLVWYNTRMRLTPETARVLSADPPVPVSERWLNGLPQGLDLTAPSIPRRGQRFPGPDGALTPAGQIFRVPSVAGTPERWYAQLPDGLSDISATQARLLLDVPGAAAPRDLTPAAAASRPSRTNLHNRALPESPPRIAAYEAQQPLCAIYKDAARLSTEARFTVGGALPAPSVTSSNLDQVLLPGGGSFVGVLTARGRPPQSFALLTDQGIRYPVPTSEDIAKLGYSPAKATPIPTNLLQLFKKGPTLTGANALRPVPAR
ncbi:type VII secretion protein EccB [Actinomadura sp. NEAU-AAG7]|uniref:type VII secretion protein EccB n=1 Tax=Actinomadura sp. NEAU-AAG7 TaxID=2839640 RepID=UPI001BE482D9|nr:type VII secretion protein EccB [Actinomadura sp. NEAU-AAG7]MBT2212986.1 type VII secretion protein EccB [Actinomadura sp. NEAU-AAG7]